jgi:predicted nucleic acid binding AN1-type Zn finger protein
MVSIYEKARGGAHFKITRKTRPLLVTLHKLSERTYTKELSQRKLLPKGSYFTLSIEIFFRADGFSLKI